MFGHRFFQSRVRCFLCMSLGAMHSSAELRRACLMSAGSTPCFPSVPGVGRQLKVQTDSLPHALHGKSSEIKGFVCTANNKDCSQFITCQGGKMIQWVLSCSFCCYNRYCFIAKQEVDNLFFLLFTSLCRTGRTECGEEAIFI